MKTEDPWPTASAAPHEERPARGGGSEMMAGRRRPGQPETACEESSASHAWLVPPASAAIVRGDVRHVVAHGVAAGFRREEVCECRIFHAPSLPLTSKRVSGPSASMTRSPIFAFSLYSAVT